MESEPVQNHSTNPAPESKEKFRTIKGGKKPRKVVPLLTASEAFELFPGLYYRKLYYMIELGLVEELRRQRRTLYSEAQIRAGLRAGNHTAFEFRRMVETAA